MGIIINNRRYRKPESIDKIIADLQTLPVAKFDCETVVDEQQSRVILQRETAEIDSAEAVRFLGTKSVSDCIFIIFTIVDPSQNKRYFTAHVDSANQFNWSRFKSYKGCTISATLIGAWDRSPQSTVNLKQVLTYLLEISQQLDLDITFEKQCILKAFNSTREDWPVDFTLRLRAKAQFLHRRIFNCALPAELAEYRFGPEYQSEAYNDPKIEHDLLQFQQNPKSSELKEKLALKLKIEGCEKNWIEFIEFLLDANSILPGQIALLQENCKHFASSKEQFSMFLKKCFSPSGFSAARVAFAELNVLFATKCNNPVYDLHSGKFIPVSREFPIGRFASARSLRSHDGRSRDYWECYNSKDGYLFPRIHPGTLQFFRQRGTAYFRDLPLGVEDHLVLAFIRDYGFGESAHLVSVSIMLELCWLAHKVVVNPEQFEPPPQIGLFPVDPPSEKVKTHIAYLNRATGVTFQHDGACRATFKSTQPEILESVKLKLETHKIAFTIPEKNLLLIEDITKFTKELRATLPKKEVPKKQADGFAFTFK